MPARTKRPALGTNMAELLDHLGGLNPGRVRLFPLPGHATEKDVVQALERDNRRFELVDGVLVEKVMGIHESFLAFALIRILGTFVKEHDLGLLTAPDGGVRLGRGVVRFPDVSFFSWACFPNRRLPRKKVPALVPTLAVEMLSKGNTAREMQRKLRDYFKAGVSLVWFFDLRTRSVQVFTAPDESLTLHETDTLEGGEVLPGFRLSLREFFAEVPEVEEEPPTRGKKKRR